MPKSIVASVSAVVLQNMSVQTWISGAGVVQAQDLVEDGWLGANLVAIFVAQWRGQTAHCCDRTSDVRHN